MKKIASLTGILLVLMAGASFAAGLNLAWDNCKGAGGVANKTVDCATTTTAQTIVGSFVLDAAMNPTSTDNQVDVQVDAAALGTFWNVGSGAGLGTRFTAGAAALGCPTWASEAVDNAHIRSTTGNRIRLGVKLFIGSEGLPINTGQEAVAFSLAVNMSDAAGTPDCPAPACFVFNRSFVEDALTTGTDATITNALAAQHVTWQGGGTINCPAATPTQKKTWGSVKALYR